MSRTSPPVYLALDLWMALGLDADDFDAYYAQNGWADTWSTLLGVVRGPKACGAEVDGGTCVLSPHSESAPHYGADDVGASKPLPWPLVTALGGERRG